MTIDDAALDALRNHIYSFVAALHDAAAALIPHLQRWHDAIRTFIADMTRCVRNAYESAGAPYGDDDTAMWMWLRHQILLARIAREHAWASARLTVW